ncbi:starch-binding protein [Bacteroidia bacterium]|nr:starch-binding protein [Bacteroidia bacterium]
MVLLPSCSDYLDVTPDNIPTVESAFADRFTAMQYLGSCYWALPRMGNFTTNPAWTGSMEMVSNKEWQNEPHMQVALGNNTATAAHYQYWGGTGSSRSLYAGIQECNTFLDNIEQVTDLPINERNREIAEAKTLKAYMHFWLLCQYGPICPLRETTSTSASVQGVKVYREKVDECFAYIIQLLDEVIDSEALPIAIANKTSELGRFTHVAACALKAKVLVYWASPLFNGNTEYSDFLDHNGEHFFNQTEDPNRWTKAAEACRIAFEACDAGGVRLYQSSDYVTQMKISDTTRRVNVLRNSLTELWASNMEVIWGNTSGWVDYDMQIAAQAQVENGNSNVTGRLGVPFSTVDLFYSNHGVPIEQDTAWLNSGRYANRFAVREGEDDHQYYIAKGQKTAEMNFEREPRFYASLGFDRGKWWGNTYTLHADENTPYLNNFWGRYSSYRALNNYNATGYFPKKLSPFVSHFNDPGYYEVQGYQAPDLRYSGLLLFYAEALNECTVGEGGTPDLKVYELIDSVRARAGLKGVVESWRDYSTIPAKPLTKAGMREIIQRERKIELALEGQDYWDSRRWKTARREQNRVVQGWNVKATDEGGYYTPTTVYIQRFVQRDYFFPIPESDLIKNPQLIQNPGY